MQGNVPFLKKYTRKEREQNQQKTNIGNKGSASYIVLRMCI